MASLKDIAQASGFSIRTVNRVLKKQGSVSEYARQRIEECAEKLNYQPNLIARSLRTGKSHSISVVIGSLDELSMAKLASVESFFREHGYIVNLVFATHPHDENDDASSEWLFEEIAKHNPAGVVLFPVKTTSVEHIVQRLAKMNLPYMSFEYAEDNIDSVTINRPQGIYEAVKYLIGKGYKKVAYLGRKTDNNRLPGYHKAIAEAGMEPLYIEINYQYRKESFFQVGKDAAKTFLDMADRPDAVQCFSDEMALGFIHGLNSHGIRIPQDVAVVGFDDRVAASFSYPLLTTVSQPNSDVGRVAAEILLEKINGKPAPAGGWSRSLPTKLVIRESA